MKKTKGYKGRDKRYTKIYRGLAFALSTPLFKGGKTNRN